jgi:hypothetical protein
MTIDEPYHETQGCRFGVRRPWTPFRTLASLARFTLVVGVALVRWTAVGQAVAKTTPRVRLPCKRQGPRRSLRRGGIQLVTPIGWPTQLHEHNDDEQQRSRCVPPARRGPLPGGCEQDRLYLQERTNGCGSAAHATSQQLKPSSIPHGP